MALQTKTITANGSKGHHKFTLNVVEESTSTANNYSVVKWSFILSPIKTGYDWSYSSTVPVSYTVTINGVKYTGNVMSYNGSATLTLKSGEEIITHNADGKKTISYSFSVTSLNQSYLTGSASNSGSMTLTPIARAATVISAPNFNDENNPTFTFSNAGGYAINARLEFGSGGRIHRENISNTGSYTFVLTDTERKVLRQACTGKTMTVRFVIATKIGSTSETHWHWADRTLTIVNDTPTLNPTAVDSNATTVALTGNNNVFVKHYSTATMTFNAAAKKEANIIYQEIQVDGKKAFNEIVNANAPIDKPNVITPTFKFIAKDSRGNTIEKTITKNAVNYIKLTCEQTVKPELVGETTAKATITIKGNYFNGSFGAANNTLTIQVRRTDDSGTMGAWQTVSGTPTLSNGTYTLTTTITGLKYDKAYTFQSRAIDKLATVEAPQYTAKLTPVFDWGESDFKFNVPVTINGGTVPTIVEQGSKNGWNYRKWSNGIGECWTIITSNQSVTTPWGNLYAGSGFGRQSYPFQFVGKPVEQATLQSGSAAGFLMTESGGNGVNGSYASAVYNIVRPNAAEGTYYLSLYCIGTYA